MNEFRERLAALKPPAESDTFGETFQKFRVLFALASDILDKLTEPCTYEAKPLPFPMIAPSPTAQESSQWGTFCTRHGWYCPNNGGTP